jgi:hexosaminidase
MKFRLIFNCVAAAFFVLIGTASPAAPAVIPLPQQLQVRVGSFTLCPTQSIPGLSASAPTKILVDSATQPTGRYLAELLLKSTGFQFQIETNPGATAIKGAIVLSSLNSNTNLGNEGYELTVTPGSVLISARSDDGAFYGAQTFLQLLPPAIFAQRPVAGVPWMAPCVYVQDKPRFAWRGCMLDAVRHFLTKDEVKRFIDGMALLKLNKLHIHLADDQGWRLEILKYPLLTQVGGWRDDINWGLNRRASLQWNSNGKYGGFYTQADVRELVAYAQTRHITIVPEIEMPGHSTAAASAYPQYFCDPGLPYDTDTLQNGPGVFCPARPETMPFLQDILTEVLDLFPSPYIHIGGDEVKFQYWAAHSLDVAKTNQLGIGSWQKYQAWFTQQIANWLHDHGRLMVGWSEIQNGGILTNAVCMDWLTGASSKAIPTASAGQFVVMSPNASCYYNYYQYVNNVWSLEPRGQGGNLPLDAAYSFEPIPATLPSQYTNYILGAQGNLWSEYFPTLLNVQFRAYPRLCAMAEIDWTPASLKNYSNFTQRVIVHQQRLEQLGINYNRGAVPQIGSWTPAQTPATYGLLQWDITTNVVAAGELNVSFLWTVGSHGLDIAWTALRENGIEIDRDAHAGFTGVTPTNAVYTLRLPARKRNAIYTIQSSVQGRGGTNSTGNVYLPNWN